VSDASDLERTESATARRLEQAREEGQVARSAELSTFVVLVAGSAALWAMGDGLVGRMAGIVRRGLAIDAASATDAALVVQRLHALAVDGLLALIPLFVVLAVAALAAPLLTSGWIFTPGPLKPDLSRLDPLRGFARMLSPRAAVELAKAAAKALLVGGFAVWAVRRNLDVLTGLAGTDIDSGLRALAHTVALSVLLVVCGLMLVAAADAPWQLWTHARRLRMTREEVRREAKETEGNPQVKGHIRRLQREAARKRMMAAVPRADVVVTNPTHYAVALRYEGEKMRAPRVVAKGAGLIAQRIRELAQAHRVPVLEAPPLARALYAHAELGDEIPEKLYAAVAELLAYVFQLRRYHEHGGACPRVPADLAVPRELDPLAAESP
jgi:flagellar biosynthetic protein FlhB